MTELLVTACGIMLLLMTVTWLIYRLTDRPDIVDVSWAFGLAVIALTFGFIGEGWLPRRVLLATLVGFWGFRLAFHLLHRIATHGEDGRYTAMRKEWKSNIPRRFFFFFQIQALLNVVLSIPFALIVSNDLPEFHWLEIAASFLFAVSLAGESIADAQLRAFKNNPDNRGKVCQDGLWNYSRHPNYFFEWSVWVAYFLFACASPLGWLTVFCPILMLYFLLKVTGIPSTEQQSVRSKGEAYRAYQQTTSQFIPWFKKRGYSHDD